MQQIFGDPGGIGFTTAQQNIEFSIPHVDVTPMSTKVQRL